MNNNLILEYLFIQFLIFVIAFFAYKRLKNYLINDKDNGLGIGSTFGIILGSILFSTGAFYANIIKKISFSNDLFEVIVEMFK